MVEQAKNNVDEDIIHVIENLQGKNLEQILILLPFLRTN